MLPLMQLCLLSYSFNVAASFVFVNANKMEKGGAQWKPGVARRYYSEEQTWMRTEFSYSNVIPRGTCTIKFHGTIKLASTHGLFSRVALLTFYTYLSRRIAKRSSPLAFQNIFTVQQFTLKAHVRL